MFISYKIRNTNLLTLRLRGVVSSSITIPSSDVESDVVLLRCELSISICVGLCPSSLSGGDEVPELHEALELPGLEPSVVCQPAGIRF